MIEPLRVSLDVACSQKHAFWAWTSGISAWWPRDHTVTGERDVVVVLQHGAGGRIYERTPGGVEHDWGEVTVWEPPARLSYRWHMRQDEVDATDVDVRFVPQGAASTRVEIEHSGWERLGAGQDAARDRNRQGWETLLPHFAAAVTKGDE